MIDYKKLLLDPRNTRPMAWLLANASNADRACEIFTCGLLSKKLKDTVFVTEDHPMTTRTGTGSCVAWSYRSFGTPRSGFGSHSMQY